MSTTSPVPAQDPSSSRKGKRKELTPYERGKIEGAHQFGLSLTEIAKTLGLPIPTVQNTLKINPQREQGKSLPRTGRPPKLTERDRRRILNVVRQDPKAGNAKIIRETGLKVSTSVIARFLANVRSAEQGEKHEKSSSERVVAEESHAEK